MNTFLVRNKTNNFSNKKAPLYCGIKKSITFKFNFAYTKFC